MHVTEPSLPALFGTIEHFICDQDIIFLGCFQTHRAVPWPKCTIAAGSILVRFPPCHCHLLLFNSLTISFGQLSLKKAFMLVGPKHLCQLGQNCSQTDPIPTSPSCPLGLHHHGYFRWMPFVLIEHHSCCMCLYKFIIKASCKRKPNSSNTTIVSHSVKLTALPSCILHLFDYKKP